MPFDVDVAEVVLGMVAPHELPAVCERALSEGFDSRSLRILAGISAVTYNKWEVEELWRAVVRELEIVLPSVEQAARIVIEYTARRAISGDTSPEDAVAHIVHGAYYGSGADQRDRRYAGDSLNLGAIVGLHYELSEVDQPWTRSAAEIRKDMLEELHRLIGEKLDE